MEELELLHSFLQLNNSCSFSHLTQSSFCWLICKIWFLFFLFDVKKFNIVFSQLFNLNLQLLFFYQIVSQRFQSLISFETTIKRFDWISDGTFPNGVCGECLLLSYANPTRFRDNFAMIKILHFDATKETYPAAWEWSPWNANIFLIHCLCLLWLYY